jgi:hypothetical protein
VVDLLSFGRAVYCDSHYGRNGQSDCHSVARCIAIDILIEVVDPTIIRSHSILRYIVILTEVVDLTVVWSRGVLR